MFESANETTTSSSGNWTREHRLVFNVTSVGREEDIYLAELRLLTLVETDREMYNGINRRVTVYEIDDESSVAMSTGNSDGLTPGNTLKYLIASKEIYGRESGWETFTVTDAVRRWVRSRSILQVFGWCQKFIKTFIHQPCANCVCVSE